MRSHTIDEPVKNRKHITSCQTDVILLFPSVPVTPYGDDEDSSSAGDSNVSDLQKIKQWASVSQPIIARHLW